MTKAMGAGVLVVGMLGGMLAGLAASTAGAAITTPTTIRVSSGSGTNGGRELSSMSADGRYVVFVGRSSATQGVYLVDRRTGTTTRLTTSNDMNPSISPDGHYVAFARYGSNRGVWMINTQTKALTLQSVSSTGTTAGGNSDFPSVSTGGRYVAFQSSAKNLGGPTSTGGGPTKVYVHDNVTGTTVMASVTSTGAAPKGNATRPAITPDGKYVAFRSDAANLLPTGGATALNEVYVHDMTTGTTTIASVSSSGAVANKVNPTPTAGTATVTETTTTATTINAPSISDNGQYVAFESLATNLVTGDTNGVQDAFVHDMTTGTTIRVSVDANGAQAVPSPLPTGVTDATTPLFAGQDPRISGDGTTVAFATEAPLTSDDTNGVMDVYTYTMGTGAIERMSVPVTGGVEASGTRVSKTVTVAQINGSDPSIGSDGRYVGFTSDGNLSADRTAAEATSTSWEPAIFVRTRNVPTVTAVSPTSVGLARTAAVVTVTGTNFTQPSSPGDLTVTFGAGVTTTSVKWISATTLEATINVAWNATLGNRVVTVTNPGNDVGSLPTGFTLTARGTGYRMAAADGGTFNFGSSLFYGSMGGQPLNKPVVGMADTETGNGYWMVATDGGVFAFGDATFYGSMGGKPLNQPIVGLAATPDGGGYWEVASDGGIFAFGDAAFYGSMGGKPLNQPIVGVAATPDGGGYWLVAKDGGIFAFGDAQFYGSMGGKPLNQPIVGVAATPDGGGYWLVAKDGGIFAFGSATFSGSMGGKPLNKSIVGMAAVPTGGGYWMVATDGGVFAFGTATFYGSMGSVPLNQPVVAMTAD